MLFQNCEYLFINQKQYNIFYFFINIYIIKIYNYDKNYNFYK